MNILYRSLYPGKSGIVIVCERESKNSLSFNYFLERVHSQRMSTIVSRVCLGFFWQRQENIVSAVQSLCFLFVCIFNQKEVL